jgi:hypothetical protein
MLKLEDLTLRLHPADNVVVVKRPLKPGVELESGSLRLVMAKGIPPGHKLAITEIPDGAAVTKYGQTIGFAKGRIAPGDHVHTRLRPRLRVRGGCPARRLPSRVRDAPLPRLRAARRQGRHAQLHWRHLQRELLRRRLPLRRRPLSRAGLRTRLSGH